MNRAKQRDYNLDSDFNSISQAVLSPVRQSQFAGYDPFDHLNSSLFKKMGLSRFELTRLIWLQFGKRCPINFRPLVGVEKKRNPKGIALFILGLLEDFKRNKDRSLLDEASELAGWLISNSSDQSVWQHYCWGYHFDWQARAFYVPKGKPNIITTCYVSRALYELGIISGKSEYIDSALDAAYFIYKHLLTTSQGKTFLAYIPGETALVHNASLWGAAWLAHSGGELGDTKLQDTALEVARLSANEQRTDGSWVYGDRHHHQFIDGFHSGYNLEALKMISDALGTSEFNNVIQLGLRFYRDTFFLPDGTAKYYSDNIYPLDMHSFAQGVLTLLKLDQSDESATFVRKIMNRAIELMYQPDKQQFIYQKHRWYANKINYIRWTQAWSYYALAYYCRHLSETNDETY